MLGVEVEHADDNRVPGHFDARISYGDGREAALEVTTIGDPKAIEMLSKGTELLIPATRIAWDLRYPVSVRMKDVQRHIPEIICWCDQFGFTDPRRLREGYLSMPAMRWYERSGVRLMGMPTARRGGVVYVLPEGSGGIVDDELRGLPAWIESQQTAPWFADNRAKLARSGIKELHLFVRVHDTGLPFSLFAGLIDPIQIRATDPRGMAPLTDLWLLPPYGQIATRWSSVEGWSVHSYSD